MKKKFFAFVLAGLLTTGSILATVYDYYIRCNDGTEQIGCISAESTQEAFETLGYIASDLCGG
ncbi:MAG: hypothetical protein ACK5KP_11495 [Paludibacteraceae bacterium]